MAEFICCTLGFVASCHPELTQVMESTEQSRSQVLEDAIAQYLKKTRRAKSITRIEALERRVDAIAALVVKG
jgi:predicted transcriptional regulator